MAISGAAVPKYADNALGAARGTALDTTLESNVNIVEFVANFGRKQLFLITKNHCTHVMEITKFGIGLLSEWRFST